MKVLGFQIEINGTQRAISTSEELRRAIADINKELKKANDPKAIKELEKELIELKARQNEVNKEVRESTKTRQQELTAVDKSSGAYNKLSKELNDARHRYKDLAAAEQGSTQEAKDLLKQISLLDNKLKNIDGSVGQFQRNVGNYTSALKGFGDVLTGGLVTGGFVAFAQLAQQGIRELFKLNKEIADLQADVVKTTGLSFAQAQALTEQLKKLDTRTTIEELLNISTVAGRLGVEGEKGVFEFTKAIDTLNVALGDDFSGGVEEVTDQVGKLSNVLFGATTDGELLAKNLLSLGNGLNVLAASGAASAGGITQFSSRISGLATPLGVTAGEILGISATLEELGVNAERGGTATGRIFQALTQDSEKFAKEFGITSKVLKDAGFDAKNFTDLVNTDLVGALQLASKQALTLSSNNVDLSKKLKEVGLTGAGELEVFLKLGNANERLSQNIGTANDALKSQDSLLSEAKAKNDNLAGAYERLTNEVREFFISSGVQSFFVSLIDGARGAFDRFKELLGIFSPLVSAFGELAKVLGFADKEGRNTAEGQKALNDLFVAATFPLRALVFALTKLVQAYTFVIDKGQDLLKFLSILDEKQEGTAKASKASLDALLGYVTVTKKATDETGKYVKVQAGANKTIKDYTESIENADKAGDKFVKGSVNEIENRLSKLNKAFVGAVAGSDAQAKIAANLEKVNNELEAALEKQNKILFAAQRKAVAEQLSGLSTLATIAVPGILQTSKDTTAAITKDIEKITEVTAKNAADAVKATTAEIERLAEESQRAFENIISGSEQLFGAALDVIGAFQSAKAEREQEAFDLQIEQIDENINTLEEKQQNVGRIRAKQIQREIDAAKRQREAAEAQAEEAQKKAAKREKTLALLQAVVQGSLAVIRALAAPPGFPLNLGSVVLTTALAGAQIATIAAQPLAEGGVITGRRVTDRQNIPTQAKGDNVLAVVKRGEVVLNEGQQRRLGGYQTFKSIGVPGFASGGVIGAPTISAPALPALQGENMNLVQAINEKTDAINGRIDRLQAYVVSEDIRNDLQEGDRLRVEATL